MQPQDSGMSIFEQNRLFMEACGQTTRLFNPEQVHLYRKLIGEEVNEFDTAWDEKNRVEMADAVTDILVVTIGLGLSCGLPLQALWDEVLRSNMAKVDPATGKVTKREDGKILKPEGWTKPDIAGVLAVEDAAAPAIAAAKARSIEPTEYLATFTSHKVVQAGEIVAVVPWGCYVKDKAVRGAVHLRQFEPGMTSRYMPKHGDFWVVYPDGYQSISPRQAFLDGYRRA